VLLASCTRFWLNRSFSIFSSFAFLFIAPGRLFMLVRCIFACPVSTLPSAPASSRPDSASASDSRFATSFLFGRRRFCDLVDDFSILETKDECLILSLSFFDAAKALSSSSDSGWGSEAAGRTARADFARAVVRFLIGAYARQHPRLSCDVFGGDAYHSCAVEWHE
jgi:hypothetical protein